MRNEREVTKFKLNNGAEIPAVGLGTIAVEESPETVQAAVLKAIEIGYRHFDTASLYKTEKPLGKALQEAFASGLVNREDVFVTTKIGPHELHIEEILPSLQRSLSNLQLAYVDLYLVHWPVRWKPEAKLDTLKDDDFLPLDFKATWEAMEKLVELGLTKAIGVSNFCVKRLQEILAHAKIAPAVNQVELHPQWQQAKLRAYCQKKGIHLTAWSPLCAPGRAYGTKSLIGNTILEPIAKKHGKSVAQVCLRWIVEQGISAVPKSYNEGRLIENISINDFSLTDEDHEKIKTIQQAKLFPGEKFFKGTPWPSFEEFWDDDE